jgi:bacterioferritin
MKGNPEVIKYLNSLLTDELTAINQYMVHSEMCENWGYEKLHEAIRKQAFDEMKHAEWLIERILYFDSTPTVSVLKQIRVGKSVMEMISNDNEDEHDAVRAYNEAIKFAHDVQDEGTVDLLTKIILMEEGHIDWAEKQSAQIEQMGIENYLSNQVPG